MLPIDKELLQKRGIIESVGDILKNHLQLEQTRHRSWWGFFDPSLLILDRLSNARKEAFYRIFRQHSSSGLNRIHVN